MRAHGYRVYTPRDTVMYTASIYVRVYIIYIARTHLLGGGGGGSHAYSNYT